MHQDKEIVNALWIGDRLSKIELLTICSFLDNGHPFRLWLYEPLLTSLPAGVQISDAAEIIPRERIFTYKNENKYGHGKGSVAGFSDIFRYKLLYEKGGWWVDMDVTCLRPFNFSGPYFFRDHHELKVVGNVMKCPAGSELMEKCYAKAVELVKEDNTDWHKPIEILNEYIALFRLENCIQKNVSNPDQWDITSRFIRYGDPLPSEWFFIHWQNEEWRSRKISKETFYYKSTLANLLQKYRLFNKPSSLIVKLSNTIKHF